MQDLLLSQTASSTGESALPLWQRLWIYQHERFPLAKHGLAILAFSSCAVALSAALRGTVPSALALIAAFISSLAFFFQLRVIDEFKDHDQDCRYRSYRPVPRGLVSLGELATVALSTAGLQLSTAFLVDAKLVYLLLAAWLFLFAMSQEFFAGPFLEEHPILYMATHMMVMPVIDCYTTACDWLPASQLQPNHWLNAGLIVFLLVSYSNGMVIEIGRKIRPARDEEPGVTTYSKIWGIDVALHNWLALVLTTTLLAGTTAWIAGCFLPVLLILTAAGTGIAAYALRFARAPESFSASPVEKLAGIWTLAVYGGLGLSSSLTIILSPLPCLLHMFS